MAGGIPPHGRTPPASLSVVPATSFEFTVSASPLDKFLLVGRELDERQLNGAMPGPWRPKQPHRATFLEHAVKGLQNYTMQVVEHRGRPYLLVNVEHPAVDDLRLQIEGIRVNHAEQKLAIPLEYNPATPIVPSPRTDATSYPPLSRALAEPQSATTSGQRTSTSRSPPAAVASAPDALALPTATPKAPRSEPCEHYLYTSDEVAALIQARCEKKHFPVTVLPAASSRATDGTHHEVGVLQRALKEDLWQQVDTQALALATAWAPPGSTPATIQAAITQVFDAARGQFSTSEDPIDTQDRIKAMILSELERRLPGAPSYAKGCMVDQIATIACNLFLNGDDADVRADVLRESMARIVLSVNPARELTDAAIQELAAARDRKIAFAYNPEGNHWIGVVAQVKGGRVQVKVADSASGPIPDALIADIRSVYPRAAFETFKSKLEQHDGSSCGPLAVENTLAMVGGMAPKRRDPMDIRRRHLALANAPGAPAALTGFADRQLAMTLSLED